MCFKLKTSVDTLRTFGVEPIYKVTV